MSGEPLARIAAAVAGLTEPEVAELLSRASMRPLALSPGRTEAPRTPLPGSRGGSRIRSEVEWV